MLSVVRSPRQELATHLAPVPDTEKARAWSDVRAFGRPLPRQFAVIDEQPPQSDRVGAGTRRPRAGHRPTSGPVRHHCQAVDGTGGRQGCPQVEHHVPVGPSARLVTYSSTNSMSVCLESRLRQRQCRNTRAPNGVMIKRPGEIEMLKMTSKSVRRLH